MTYGGHSRTASLRIHGLSARNKRQGWPKTRGFQTEKTHSFVSNNPIEHKGVFSFD
jgi:hypothetical protein